MSKLRIAPRRTPPQPDPPKAAALPNAARAQLGTLVTEVRGASRLLYFDGVAASTEDMAAAIGFWLERIAHDLEMMECREYPIISAEAK
jgi:hypothetical protein